MTISRYDASEFATRPADSIPEADIGLNNGTSPTHVDDNVSLAALGSTVLRHRRLIFWMAVVALIATASVTVMLPRTYTSAVQFMPQGATNQASSLAGVAAQFGIALPMAAGNAPSPDFYASLLDSRAFKAAIVDTRYHTDDSSDTSRTQDLVDYLSPGTDPRAARRELAMLQLKDHITTLVDATTGIVTTKVSTDHPRLSNEITNRVVELINSFNLDVRQSQAKAERVFAEQRLAEANGELRSAEDRLEAFLRDNRDLGKSPTLQFESNRLQRDVSFRQQVVASLAQTYEQARLTEVREAPVITIVSPPVVAALPDRRYLALKAVLAVVGGGMLAVFLAFAIDLSTRSSAADQTERRELLSLWADTRKDAQKFIPRRIVTALRHRRERQQNRSM